MTYMRRRPRLRIARQMRDQRHLRSYRRPEDAAAAVALLKTRPRLLIQPQNRSPRPEDARLHAMRLCRALAKSAAADALPRLRFHLRLLRSREPAARIVRQADQRHVMPTGVVILAATLIESVNRGLRHAMARQPESRPRARLDRRCNDPAA